MNVHVTITTGFKYMQSIAQLVSIIQALDARRQTLSKNWMRAESLTLMKFLFKLQGQFRHQCQFECSPILYQVKGRNCTSCIAKLKLRR